MKATKKFYIKERYNPQLGTYYVAMGALTRKEAKAKEKMAYGSASLIGYDTEEAYKAAVNQLVK